VKDRLSELRKEKPSLSLKNIASKIPIQYTYLSKAMNDGKTHVNEDHLFTMAQILDFVPKKLITCCFVDRTKQLAIRIEKNIYILN